MGQTSLKGGGNMKPLKVIKFVFVCIIVDIAYRLVKAVDGHAQAAFIQTDGELRYLVDGVSLQMHQFLTEESSAVSFTDLEDENLNTYASPIIFEPPSLDFKSHPVGMPRLERVVVFNPSQDTSIHVLSISGNTLHFHCSFFQDKIIPPGGNTSFDIVFLGRQEGRVENTLFIHTSLGSFKYQVTAVGVPNPYRLRPFLGVKMPLNSSYTPLIHIYNPHSSTLQLTEMYSSGGDLHLELPTGEPEGPQLLWQIPPYATKPVMRANFLARIEKNHTVYIRIKTNSSVEEYLILPVEVEVTSAPGIYSPIEVLDFGVLRSQDEPKTLTLHLLNSGQKHIHIVNVIVAPVNEAVEVKFNPVKIPPDTRKSTQIASVTFTPSKAIHPKQFSGKIVIKAKNNQFKLTIPYEVTLLHGNLGYNETNTRFYVGQEVCNATQVRQLEITNNFNITLVIYNVSFPEEAKPYFKAKFSGPVVLSPSKSTTPIVLTFRPSDTSLQFTTYLRLHTNISYFDIPLMFFSGKLKLYLPHAINQHVMDFGTMGMGDKHAPIFAVINENPVEVNLKHWGSNMTKTYVELVGLEQGNASMLARRHNFSNLAKSLTLKPHHYAIFRLGVTAPATEGFFVGEAFIETQYENLKIPFTLRTAKGSLVADNLVFENAFPGKISSQNFYIHSSFSHPMTVSSIYAIPEDSRFYYEPNKNSPSVLQPGTISLVDKVYFDPRRECKDECYSGLPTSTTMGKNWLSGMSLPPDVGDIDKELYKKLYGRWQDIVNNGEKNINITLHLDTNEVRGFLLKGQATLQWPRLTSKCHLRFPITQIGNISVKDFALENPSSLPVIAQVLVLSSYPSSETAVTMLSHRLGGANVALKYSDTNQTNTFQLQDLEEFNTKADNPIPAYRKSLEEFFGVQPHMQSLAILLTPGMRVRVLVGFLPKDEAPQSSLILIRNNLTVMDAIVLQGKGGYGKIKFGNKNPGSEAVLMFDLTEKHLKDCDNARVNRFTQPNFTVRRTFTARNVGELPVYISGFDIDGIPCEGYGFRILNCHGFELQPNDTKKVDIAYTPDFTLARVERTLNIHTSWGSGGNSLQYTLVATLPRHILQTCSQAIPRPSWEPLLYYCAVILAGFLLFCVVVVTYLEGDRILKTAFFPITTTTLTLNNEGAFDKGQLFDLRNTLCPDICNSSSKNGKVQGNSESKKRSENGVITNGTTYLPSHTTTQIRRHSNGNTVPSKKDGDSIQLCKKDGDNKDDLSGKSGRRKALKLKSGREDSPSVRNSSIFSANEAVQKCSWSSLFKKPFSLCSLSDPNGLSSTVATNNKEEESAKLGKKEKTQETATEAEALSVMPEKNFKHKSHRKGPKNYENKVKKKVNLAEEETSSTTTETSNPESDISEKDNRLQEVCSTEKSSKNRWSKQGQPETKNNGSDNAISLGPSVVDSDGTDGEFELCTKGRSHRRLKIDTSKVFVGDILNPCNLELPYKPKPANAIDKTKERHRSIEPKSTDAASRGSSRHSTYRQRVYHTNRASESECSDKGKESPPPVWDPPSPALNHDDAMKELSQQSESFARFHGSGHCNFSATCGSARTHPSSVTFNSSDRGTKNGMSSHLASYSAVVSGEKGSNKGKNKSAASAWHLDNKGSANTSFPQVSSTPLTTPHMFDHSSYAWKPLYSPSNSSNLSFSSSFAPHDSDFSSWILPPGPTKPGSSSLGDAIAEAFAVKEDPLADLEELSNVTDTDGSDLSGSKASTWSKQRMTVMQALQAERRQRIEEYQKLRSLQGEWPGFEIQPFEESLWDANYVPSSDTWGIPGVTKSMNKDSSIEDSFNPSPSLSHLWKSGSDALWSPSCNLWSSSSFETSKSSTSVTDTSTTGTSTEASESVDSINKQAQPNGFDPFNSVTALWKSNITVDDNPASLVSKNRSFSLFSDPGAPQETEDKDATDEAKHDDTTSNN